MDVKLEPQNEAALRKIAESVKRSPEQDAAEVLGAHVESYDRRFREAVQKGLDDVAAGRVLSIEESKERDATRRERLKERIRSQRA